jgi:hypothetical protein
MLGFFMRSAPLWLLLLFMPCAACTYMPNASWRRRGGKAQGEGYLPSEAERRTSAAKVCTSAARKTVGKPLAPRQGSALSKGLVSLFACERTHEFQGRALRGRIQAPHGWGEENARYYGRLERGKGEAPFPKQYGNGISSFDKC